MIEWMYEWSNESFNEKKQQFCQKLCFVFVFKAQLQLNAGVCILVWLRLHWISIVHDA